MGADYTYLNKAYPKDSFPLSRIHQLVDSTSSHELLIFMNAFFRYNQSKMVQENDEHTTFITDKGL